MECLPSIARALRLAAEDWIVGEVRQVVEQFCERTALTKSKLCRHRIRSTWKICGMAIEICVELRNGSKAQARA